MADAHVKYLKAMMEEKISKVEQLCGKQISTRPPVRKLSSIGSVSNMIGGGSGSEGAVSRVLKEDILIPATGKIICVTKVFVVTPANLPYQDVGWVHRSCVDSCMICNASFGVVNRKHNCFACGYVVCNTCSNYEAEIMQLQSPRLSLQENNEKYRVCNRCIKGAKKVSATTTSFSSHLSQSTSDNSMQRVIFPDEEDEEGATDQEAVTGEGNISSIGNASLAVASKDSSTLLPCNSADLDHNAPADASANSMRPINNIFPAHIYIPPYNEIEYRSRSVSQSQSTANTPSSLATATTMANNTATAKEALTSSSSSPSSAAMDKAHVRSSIDVYVRAHTPRSANSRNHATSPRLKEVSSAEAPTVDVEAERKQPTAKIVVLHGEIVRDNDQSSVNTEDSDDTSGAIQRQFEEEDPAAGPVLTRVSCGVGEICVVS